MVDNAPTAAIPRIFKLDLIVPQEATDEFGHVNNQRYVAWMQEVATAHSASQWLADGALSGDRSGSCDRTS
jgi:acyl-CoA thioesterase FadM